MTPSSEIRNMAADLHDAASKADDLMREADDAGRNEESISDLDRACMDAWKAYYDFTEANDMELTSDASGLCIRCAKTGIPICITDEIEDLDSGEVAIREAAYAA